MGQWEIKVLKVQLISNEWINDSDEAGKLGETNGSKTWNSWTKAESTVENLFFFLYNIYVLKPSNGRLCQINVYVFCLNVSFFKFTIYSVFIPSKLKKMFWHLAFSLCNYVIALRNKKYIHTKIPFINEP